METAKVEMTREIAAKVLALVDHGLVAGLGKPEPGKMCIEAAVCYALGEPHGDQPSCVASFVRSAKIRLNDANWPSDKARAAGMRKVAIAQLGSAGNIDRKEFLRYYAEQTIRRVVPFSLRKTAGIKGNAAHKDALLNAASVCEASGTRDSALEAKLIARNAVDAAYADAAAYAADAADAAAAADARLEALLLGADVLLDALLHVKSPGCQWLDLCDEVAA